MKMLLQKKRPIAMAILILAGCKGESKSSRIDSAAVAADSSASREGQNSFAAFAGDTLELISVGGHPLPQPSGVPLPCDSARTPLRQRIVASADTSYWQLTVVRPGCRDTVKFRSDSLEIRGNYWILGDTLHLYYGSGKESYEFFGKLFPDSVVQIGTGADRVWRYSRRSGVPGNPVEGHMRTDSVYLARDIDGSGKTDHVVQESRMGRMMETENRLAVYLDADPGSRAPDLATAWDIQGDEDQMLNGFFTVAPGVTLLDIATVSGDGDRDQLFIVEKGKIRRELTHGIDYGNGYLTITQDAGKVVVDATLENLELRDTPVTSDIKCTVPQMGAMKLVFEAKTGRFTPGRAFCAKLPTAAP
jgi:hypothetical protein